MATPLALASNDGSAAARPSGNARALRRWSRASESGFAADHAAYCLSQASPKAAPRSRRARVWAMTSSGTSKVCSGSQPRTFLVAATSSSPRALP